MNEKEGEKNMSSDWKKGDVLVAIANSPINLYKIGDEFEFVSYGDINQNLKAIKVSKNGIIYETLLAIENFKKKEETTMKVGDKVRKREIENLEKELEILSLVEETWNELPEILVIENIRDRGTSYPQSNCKKIVTFKNDPVRWDWNLDWFELVKKQEQEMDDRICVTSLKKGGWVFYKDDEDGVYDIGYLKTDFKKDCCDICWFEDDNWSTADWDMDELLCNGLQVFLSKISRTELQKDDEYVVIHSDDNNNWFHFKYHPDYTPNLANFQVFKMVELKGPETNIEKSELDGLEQIANELTTEKIATLSAKDKLKLRLLLDKIYLSFLQTV